MVLACGAVDVDVLVVELVVVGRIRQGASAASSQLSRVLQQRRYSPSRLSPFDEQRALMASQATFRDVSLQMFSAHESPSHLLSHAS